MAKNAIIFGVLLIVLGIASFVATGSMHKTALIPAYFGAAIALCGIIALNANLRMHAMHGAAMVAVLGFIGALVPIIIGVSHGIPRPVALLCQAIMLVLCGGFVGLCVKSFRDARRNRISDAN